MTRGNVRPLTPDQVVARARSLAGKPITYHLDYPNGGMDPYAADCADNWGTRRVADCIGFAAWASGFDRYCPAPHADHPAFPLYDGYINTDSMIEEATTRGVWFQVHDRPEPGMMIVAESYRKKLPPWRRVIGHVGVIVAVHGSAPEDILVTHCSPSNYPYTEGRSAIWTSNASIWFNYYPRHYYVSLNLKGLTP